jgi:hypothetical protein
MDVKLTEKELTRLFVILGFCIDNWNLDSNINIKLLNKLEKNLKERNVNLEMVMNDYMSYLE